MEHVLHLFGAHGSGLGFADDVRAITLCLSPDFSSTRAHSAMYSATCADEDASMSVPAGDCYRRTEGSAKPMGMRQKSAFSGERRPGSTAACKHPPATA